MPSRVVFGPHETHLARRRDISDRHVAYYARRARGGAGIVITETASVHDSDHPYERAPLAADAVPGWADVVRACRPHGTVVLAGLGHAGSQGSSAYHRRVLWAPSAIPDVTSREIPAVMGAVEITALVDGFATATAGAVAAGCAGVEVDAGQYSLLRQFLSGLTNQRDDHYGGTAQGRRRLLVEVLTAVRAVLGDRVLALRLAADELAPWAGITPSEGIAHAVAVAPLVDLLTVVRGCALRVDATRPDLHTAPGFNTELCRAVRAAVAGSGTQVVLQGSVVDPAAAAEALDDGTADLVEMTRAQIAEPDLVSLVRAGAADRVRPCTLSMARGPSRDVGNPIVSDEAEPSAGHELDEPQVARAPRRHVLVIGGGPAGMEAARVLALRGHRVRLAERSDRLGGSLLLAARLPGRARMGLLVDWWEAELRTLGVRVSLCTELAPHEVADGDVLATGSVPGPLPYPVTGVPVLSAGDYVARDIAAAPLPPGPVLVRDPIGDYTGVGVAELLAADVRDVVLVTPDRVCGHELGRIGGLVDANARLVRAGVRRRTSTLVDEVGPGGAVLRDRHTGELAEEPVVAVIDCGHRLPNHTLGGAHRIGDCVAPRAVHDAVLDARLCP